MPNKTTTKKSEAAVKKPEVIETMTDAAETVASEQDRTKKVFRPKEIDPDQYVTVKNGYPGKLVYRSKRTGELFVWESLGDEQDMELSELKNARNSAKRFFIDNWFMFDEPWIIDYLGVGKFYQYAVSLENFDGLFQKPVDEAEEIIAHLSDGQKRSLSYRARQLIADRTIDSNRMIDMLEKRLNTSLIER